MTPERDRSQVRTPDASKLVRAIAAHVGTATHRQFPPVLVRELAASLRVPGAILAERSGDARYRSVACALGSRPVAEFEFDVPASAMTLRHGSRRVVSLRLDDSDVIAAEQDVYVFGVTLRGGAPDTIGILAVLQDTLVADPTALRVLTTFARRAETELDTARNLRAHQRAEDELRAQSRIDPMTGALNHGAIAETMRELVAKSVGQKCAVVMIDVDGLKATNATYGHGVGDAILVAVARAMSAGAAAVGRYGGDEFVAVLPGADVERADQYREDVFAAVEAAGVRDPATGARVPIALSVGLAVYPDESDRIDDLIRLADNALYASRNASRQIAGSSRRLDADSAARLVSDLIPLLTAPGTREQKLGLVAHQLSVGAGYDAVNFEVSGESAEPGASWEGAYVRSAPTNVESWMREQQQATDHPLGRRMEELRKPIFIDDLDGTDLLTDPERDLIKEAGLNSALIVPMIWHHQLVGMLSVASKQPAGFTAWDAQFLTAVSSQVTAIVFMTTLVEDLKAASSHLAKAHSDTVMMLAAAAEAHDDTTGRHLQRVRLVTEMLASELGYPPDQVHQMGLAAVLHDIGKVRVPDSVLASSNALTDEEWVIMKQHTMWGGEFLSGRHGFDLAADVARCHHEKWDGSGYPRGLAGDEIPEAAAITSVADSFDAMTNDRPYRRGRPVSEAVAEIVRCKGQQFSPRVVDALVTLYHRGELNSLREQELQRAA